MLWSIAALFYAYEFLHRVAPSVLTVELKQAFSVNNHQLGTIGAMYFYAYAAFQLPAGILIDRYGTKRLLVIASGILTIGSFLFTITTSRTLAELSRFMIGAGSAFAFVGCLKIGAQWLKMSSFPLVVGLTNLCGTLGALSGGTPLSYLVQEISWRSAMLQLSFAGLFITLLLWFFLPEKQASQEKQSEHHLIAGLLLVIKNPQSWIIALYGALLVAPIVALPEMWGVEFLRIAYDIPTTTASSITHTIFIGTAIGGPFLGWLVMFVRNKQLFMCIASFIALILLLLFLYSPLPPLPYLYIILFFYGMCTANMLLCFTLMTQQHPFWAQGAAIGFTNMIIMAFGGIAQDRIGWILHKLHSGHAGHFQLQDYHYALSLLPLCLLIAMVLTQMMKSKTEKKDGRPV